MKQVPAVRAPENENGNGKANGQFLLGSTVYASPSIRFLQSRAKIWAEAVQSRGGKFTLDSNDPSITHVLVGEGGVNKVPQQLLHRSHTAISDSEEEVPLRGSGPLLVGVKWLEQSLIRGERALERTCHPPAPAVGASTPNAVSRKRSREDVDAALTASEAEVVHRQRWLGDLWHDGCAGMSQTELMLQGVYNVERSERMGNEPVVAALTELHRYERALHEDYFDSEEKGQEVINHRALRYARAASVVRGCAYKVQPDLKGGELPFIGKATAHQINDIIQNGSCATLEAFRHDVEVTDSQGKVRRDSVGGRTRAMFHALPGVGQRTAKAWWNLGLRSYEDVEAAMQPGHPLSAEGPYPISAEQAFSLRHRRDLLESVSELLGIVFLEAAGDCFIHVQTIICHRIGTKIRWFPRNHCQWLQHWALLLG